MNKKTLLALLAMPLVLASCGGTPSDSKDPKSEQPGDSSVTPGNPDSGNKDASDTSEEIPSSSEVELTREQKVTALFEKMASGASSTLEIPSVGNLEYLGENIALHYDLSDDYNDEGYYDMGIMPIANKGLYQYYIDNSGALLDLSILTPNTSITISDYSGSTYLLGQAAQNIRFTESARTHTFSTTDSTFCAVLGAMLGEDASIYTKTTASFKISDDGQTINELALSLSQPTDSTADSDVNLTGYKISKVGTTVNLDVEVIAKNPPAITAQTAWNATQKQAFDYMYTGFTIPFPTGASYAVNWNLDESEGFIFEDYGCGNKLTSYQTQLTSAGFTMDSEKSLPAYNLYYYEKTIVAATSTSGAIKAAVYVYYQTAAQAGATLYPNGIFMIQAYPYQEAITYDATTVNGFISQHMCVNSPSTPIVPTIPFTGGTDLTYEDVTDLMQSYYPDYDEYYCAIITAHYDTLEDAEEALEKMVAAFEAAGYTIYTQTADSASVYLDESASYYDVVECDVTLEIEEDENGGYIITISIDHYGFYDDWYYDDWDIYD